MWGDIFCTALSNTLAFAEIIRFLSGKSFIRTQPVPKLDESACL